MAEPPNEKPQAPGSEGESTSNELPAELPVELPAQPPGEQPSASNSDRDGTKPTQDAASLDYPDGGLQAWLVVAGSTSVFFCTLGYLNSFGCV